MRFSTIRGSAMPINSIQQFPEQFPDHCHLYVNPSLLSHTRIVFCIPSFCLANTTLLISHRLSDPYLSRQKAQKEHHIAL